MIKTFEELQKTSDSCSACLNAKFSGADGKRHVVLCGGTGCRSCKSAKVQAKLEEVIKAKGLSKEIRVDGVGCFGLCVNGPIVLIYPNDAMYEKVTVEDCEEIITNLSEGKLVERLLHKDNGSREKEGYRFL